MKNNDNTHFDIFSEDFTTIYFISGEILKRKISGWVLTHYLV